jgi:hypothetical protein
VRDFTAFIKFPSRTKKENRKVLLFYISGPWVSRCAGFHCVQQVPPPARKRRIGRFSLFYFPGQGFPAVRDFTAFNKSPLLQFFIVIPAKAGILSSHDLQVVDSVAGYPALAAIPFYTFLRNEKFRLKPVIRALHLSALNCTCSQESGATQIIIIVFIPLLYLLNAKGQNSFLSSLPYLKL